MRKLAAAALAVPVIALIYLPVLLRRSVAARVGLTLGVGAILGLAVIGIAAPGRTVATQVSTIVPLTSARFQTSLEIGHQLDGPVSVDFSAPMDRESVAASLSVEPAAAVRLAWNAAGTSLTVSPTANWSASTYYTVTVSPAARDAAGQPLGAPARAAFLTRGSAIGRIMAAEVTGRRITLESPFTIAFDRPVVFAEAVAALRVEPSVVGTFSADAGSAVTRITFTPSEPLTPDTVYALRLSGQVHDADGAPLDELPSLTVRTVLAPDVVRFRPRDDTKDVARDAAVSVRFTEAMDEGAATRFSVAVNGEAAKGSTTWAEGATVLVFEPAANFPYGAKVVATVAADALSRKGVPLGRPATASFTVEPKPAPAPVTRPAPKPAPVPIKTGGGTVGSASWSAVESYYLKIMNCTRTGGWVTSSGGCSSPGGRAVAALWIDQAIASHVSRPYAKLLATRGLCSHYADGSPGTRFRRAGYGGDYAENIGCRSGNPYSAVLASHLFYQSEKPCSGYCHYGNLMNARFDRVGIGVWVYGGRVRLVVDFYHP